MRGLTLRRPTVPVAPATGHGASLSPRAFWFMTAVVAIQGGHVVEHVIQLFRCSRSACPSRMRSACWATSCSSTAPRSGSTSATTRSTCSRLRADPAAVAHHARRRSDVGVLVLHRRQRVDRDLAHRRARRDHLQRDRQRRLPLPRDRRRRARLSDTTPALLLQRDSRTPASRLLTCCPPRSRLYAALAWPPGPSAVREARRDATRQARSSSPAWLTATAPHRIGGPDCACLLHEPAVATIEEHCSTA